MMTPIEENAHRRGHQFLTTITIRQHMALTLLAAAFGSANVVRAEEIPDAIGGAVRIADLLLVELEKPI